jgi:hypothetical protein
MKYILALAVAFILGCYGTVVENKVEHPTGIHSHYTEAQVESAMFEFYHSVAVSRRKCVGVLGIPRYFISPERDKKYYGDKCDSMPTLEVVKCSSSVNTNHLISSKVIYWACSMYFLDDYVYVSIVSEVEVAGLIKLLREG